MKELVFSELTTEQKLGLVTIGFLHPNCKEDEIDYIIELAWSYKNTYR